MQSGCCLEITQQEKTPLRTHTGHKKLTLSLSCRSTQTMLFCQVDPSGLSRLIQWVAISVSMFAINGCEVQNPKFTRKLESVLLNGVSVQTEDVWFCEVSEKPKAEFTQSVMWKARPATLDTVAKGFLRKNTGSVVIWRQTDRTRLRLILLARVSSLRLPDGPASRLCTAVSSRPGEGSACVLQSMDGLLSVLQQQQQRQHAPASQLPLTFLHLNDMLALLQCTRTQMKKGKCTLFLGTFHKK